MPYTPTVWQNSPSTATPLSAANMNKLETQYGVVADDIYAGATSVNAALSSRYPAVEGDTGWLTSGSYFTAATGWSVSGFRVRRIGKLVILAFINFTRTGSNIVVDSQGNITNATVCTIDDPLMQVSFASGMLSSAASGRMATGGAEAAGLVLYAVTPGVDITTSQALSFSGFWVTA